MPTFVRRTITAAGAVLLSASALAAQGAVAPAVERPVSFGITGGASIPTGDFGDVATTGYDIGALLEFQPAPGPLSFRIEGDYQSFSASDEFNDVFGDTDLNIISGTGNVVWRFPIQSTTVRPYLTGGVGVYHLKADSDTDALDDSETKFGLNGGAGIELPLSGLTTFVEARYHSVFTSESNTNFFPLRVGIRF